MKYINTKLISHDNLTKLKTNVKKLFKESSSKVIYKTAKRNL